jgi:hypothetical protein
MLERLQKNSQGGIYEKKYVNEVFVAPYLHNDGTFSVCVFPG